MVHTEPEGFFKLVVHTCRTVSTIPSVRTDDFKTEMHTDSDHEADNEWRLWRTDDVQHQPQHETDDNGFDEQHDLNTRIFILWAQV
jgi:hypothetical protein